ncbi:hypothetical protein Tco_0209685 [Tanacetum coccineum]
MDPMIALGQKNALAEYMILFGADNRPPMLDKDLYDSWKNRIELYMQNREHGRMILESVEHGPHIWPTVEDNGVIRMKKYVELSVAEKIQDDCNMKATNIILQGLPADIYSLSQMNHQTSTVPQVIPQVAYQSPQAPTQLMTEPPFVNSGLVDPVFSPGDDPIACLNKAMAFLTTVASSRALLLVQREIQQGGQARVVKCYNCQDEEQLAFLLDLGILADQAQTIIPYNAAFQIEDLDTYNSDCDDLSTA